MDTEMLDRGSAERYAGWFKALADPTRVQLVTLLARQRRPMTVGEMVSASGFGQSTVSHHLKALAEVCFVLCDQSGTARWYRINEACVSCFPSAADIVMGRQVPEPPTCETLQGVSSSQTGGHAARGHTSRPRASNLASADMKGARR